MRICERDFDKEFFEKERASEAAVSAELANGRDRWRDALKSHVNFAGSLILNHLPSKNPDTSSAKGFGRPKVREPSSPAKALLQNLKQGFNNKRYNAQAINDTLIGFTIGAMCIPQGMSYASLAGMPMHHGLYSNFLHPLGYFLLGTSNHIVTGSAAIENLMIGESLNNIVTSDEPAARQEAALLLSLMCSVLYIAFRLCGMAVISELLADPVLSGFATGSAFLVGASQLKFALGLSALRSQWTVPHSVYYILTNYKDICLVPVITSVLSILFLLVFKRLDRRFLPGPLLLVIVSILASRYFDLQGRFGLAVVGAIPQGLPTITTSIPSIQFYGADPSDAAVNIRNLFWEAVKISCLLFVIHISVSKTIALRRQEARQVNVGRELVAFSVMNAFAGIFGGCYPGSTSISRSCASEGMGCSVGLHGPSSALIVIAVLLWFTDWLQYLPLACLCSIVLLGLTSSLSEFKELVRLWNLQKSAYLARTGGSSPDLLLWIISFLTTLCFGATEGILISVVLSLIWIGKSILRPPFIELIRIRNTTVYRDIRRFRNEGEQDPKIVIFRIDAPLNFCNSAYLERHINHVINTRFVPVVREQQSNGESRTVTTGPSDLEEGSPASFDATAGGVFILDCSSVNGLDITSIGAIKRIVKNASEQNVIIAFSNWKGPQRDFLWRASFYDVVPPQRCFMSNHDAYLWAKAVRQHPLIATEILRSDHRVWHDESLSTDEEHHGEPHFREEIELGQRPEPEVVYEWDGLSALVPNVTIVHEQTSYGENRAWHVSKD